jgi:hypothetical protein
MNIVSVFDPSVRTSGTFSAAFPQGNGRMLVMNESLVNIMLSWDGNTTYVPAGDRRFYCINASSTVVSWSQQSILPGNASNTPNQILVESYAPGEKIVETYPAPLVRSTTVGNTISTAGGGATFIIDDNRAIGAQTIEATAAGDPGSGVTLTNTGVLTLGNATHHGSISSDNQAFKTDGSGNVTLNTISTGVANQGVEFVNQGLQFDYEGNGNQLYTDSIGPQNAAYDMATALHYPDGLGALHLGLFVNAFGTSLEKGLSINAGINQAAAGATGSVSLFQPFLGYGFLLVYVTWLGLTTTGNLDITLNVPFANTAYFLVGETQGGTINFLSSGAARTCSVQATMSATGGTQSGQTNIKSWVNGQVRGGFDKIRFNFGSSANGIMFALGN